jgi:hypothetical protein
VNNRKQGPEKGNTMRSEEVFSTDQFKAIIQKYATSLSRVHVKVDGDYIELKPDELDSLANQKLMHKVIELNREATVNLYVPYLDNNYSHVVQITYKNTREPEEY